MTDTTTRQTHPWDVEGGPAFPSEDCSAFFKGMTLRDYFAGQALAATDVADFPSPAIAANAYRIADAMLAARSAKTEG